MLNSTSTPYRILDTSWQTCMPFAIIKGAAQPCSLISFCCNSYYRCSLHKVKHLRCFGDWAGQCESIKSCLQILYDRFSHDMVHLMPDVIENLNDLYVLFAPKGYLFDHIHRESSPKCVYVPPLMTGQALFTGIIFVDCWIWSMTKGFKKWSHSVKWINYCS